MAYDEKADRKYDAQIWIGLGIFFTVLLIGLTIMLAKELLLIRNGECVTIDYKDDLPSAVITTKDKHQYRIDLQGKYLDVKDGKLKIYYYEGKEWEAKPQTPVSFWIMMYLVFGGGIAFSVMRCIKHLKPTHHSERLLGEDSNKHKFL